MPIPFLGTDLSKCRVQSFNPAVNEASILATLLGEIDHVNWSRGAVLDAIIPVGQAEVKHRRFTGLFNEGSYVIEELLLVDHLVPGKLKQAIRFWTN